MDTKKINEERLLLFKIVLITCRIVYFSSIGILLLLIYILIYNVPSQDYITAIYKTDSLRQLLVRIFFAGFLVWLANGYAQRANKEIKELKQKLAKP